MSDVLTPDLLLRGYASGIFPMAETREDDSLFWVDPHRRGVLPLDGFHLSRSLGRRIKRGGFEILADHSFADVVKACGARAETWINQPLYHLYLDLFDAGHAHSVEIRQDGTLMGGVFGVSIGAVFFGESMFSQATDGSKIALCCLIDRLRQGGYTLFDTQFITPHLASLGATEIPRDAYHEQLARALQTDANFWTLSDPVHPLEVIQRMTQTS